jgi:hypothetical protein
MFLVGCALFDPSTEEFDFFGPHGFVGLGRGHDLVPVGGEHALDQGTLGGVAWGDGPVAAEVAGGLCEGVEAEISLAAFFVLPVAVKAAVGEQGQDLFSELNGLGGRGCLERA